MRSGEGPVAEATLQCSAGRGGQRYIPARRISFVPSGPVIRNGNPPAAGNRMAKSKNGQQRRSFVRNDPGATSVSGR